VVAAVAGAPPRRWATVVECDGGVSGMMRWWGAPPRRWAMVVGGANDGQLRGVRGVRSQGGGDHD
jgi:hypothetical protein